jgi:hypothetical protein
MASLRGSRRKAWTARMPLKVSTNWTMTSATLSRVCRNATVDRSENHRNRNSSGMMASSATSASHGSSTSISTEITTMFSAASSKPSRLESSSSRRVSTSEVSRLITRPEVNRSCHATLSRWEWSNTLRRRSNRIACPMTPVRRRKIHCSTPDVSAATTSAAVIWASVR